MDGESSPIKEDRPRVAFDGPEALNGAVFSCFPCFIQAFSSVLHIFSISSKGILKEKGSPADVT